MYVEQQYPLHCCAFILGIDSLLATGSEGDRDSQREEAGEGWRGSSQMDVELAVQFRVIIEKSKANNEQIEGGEFFFHYFRKI